MDKYQIGDCLPLKHEDDVIFCEILGYKGSGYYCVNLTKGLVDTSPSKFPPMSTLHESVIEELTANYD